MVYYFVVSIPTVYSLNCILFVQSGIYKMYINIFRTLDHIFINHKTLCNLLDYIFIARRYTVHTISNIGFVLIVPIDYCGSVRRLCLADNNLYKHWLELILSSWENFTEIFPFYSHLSTNSIICIYLFLPLLPFVSFHLEVIILSF